MNRRAFLAATITAAVAPSVDAETPDDWDTITFELKRLIERLPADARIRLAKWVAEQFGPEPSDIPSLQRPKFATEAEEADWLYEHRDEIRGSIVRDDDGRPLSPAEIRARHLKRP
jgi:hypothetical protein